MKIIMTGKSGLIGSAIYERLLESGHSIISIGRRDCDYEIDLNSFKPIIQESTCDVFIHCAGVTDEEIIRDKISAVHRATSETVALFDWVSSLRPKKIVYISTAHVYGDLNKKIDECSDTVPKSLYGMLHLFSEQYLKTLGVNYLILRPLTGFGKVGKNFNRWDLIPYSFPKSLATDKKIVINTHGKQHRNFISTSTIAKIVSDEIKTTSSKVINPVGPHHMSVLDFANYCVRALSPLQKDYFEIIVQKKNEYKNQFKYLSKCNYIEDTNELKNHVINIYKKFKGDL